jgi:hypothetical protein
MGFLPSEHRMAQAFRDTVKAWETLRDPALVRERVLEKYPSDNWTDVTVNLCFILIALLAAEGSFDRAICTAASLGHDTDCTCATVGALFAILFPDSIDRRWTDPIGKELVLSRNMTNTQTPADITAFSDRVAFVCREALAYYHTLLSQRAALVARYEREVGPLTASSNLSPTSWDWVKSPWPWQM